ncbi:MAG TPA: hypothetical protein P5514_04175 [Bacteroidales bacterium]|nr:hypothetical protein [Bacteroidales bacterium]HPE55392.1 hypothetical protein [Bacteroidales bacterium]HRX96115.1 hypothetical protein [Bacteroidales bacterium]
MANLFKYLGIVAGLLGILFILCGIIGFYTGEFLHVRNFTWFFWAANSFIMLGIFGLVGYIALREK